jgi:hypothetical protein
MHLGTRGDRQASSTPGAWLSVFAQVTLLACQPRSLVLYCEIAALNEVFGTKHPKWALQVRAAQQHTVPWSG